MTFLLELFLFWIFISGNFHFLIFSLGIVAIFFVFWISKKLFNKMNELSGIEANFMIKTNFFKIIKFLFETFVEICKSSIFLIKAFLKKEKTFDKIVEFDFDVYKGQIDEINFMIFAHAITSTPGSITVKQINGGKILIHFLYKKNFDDMKNLKKSNEKVLFNRITCNF